MDLLVSPEFLLQYTSVVNKVLRDNNDRLIMNCIENDVNRLIINKAIIEEYEKNIDESDLDYIKLFLAEIINYKSTQIPISGNYTGYDLLAKTQQEYLKKPSNDIHFAIYLNSNVNITTINNAFLISAIKPNYDWIAFNLMAFSPNLIDFRHFDFLNNQQIEQLFNDFFRIARNNNYVSIYDRNTNLDHNYFNSFRNTSNVSYYTRRLSRYNPEYSETVKDLQNKFRLVRIFSAKSRDDIHERRVVIGNMILDCDEDFWNLDVNRTTWKIDISCCNIKSQKINSKQILFTRIFN